MKFDTNKLKKLLKRTWKYTISVVLVLASIITYWLITQNPQTAEATWWNDSWNYRKAITINHTQVTGDLTDFPMLVSLTDTNLGTHAQEEGNDILFIDSEGKKLSHEIEKFATTTGELIAWVKIPSLSSTQDETIYMYYGNAGVASQEDAENVWDDNYKGVWHMPDDNTASGTDSTVNQYNASVENGASTTPSGIIGGGMQYDGDNDYMQVDSLNSDFNYPVTYSMWVNIKDLNSERSFFDFGYDYSSDTGIYLTHESTNGLRIFVGDTSSDTNIHPATNTPLYFVVTVSSGIVSNLYINGSLVNGPHSHNANTGIQATGYIGDQDGLGVTFKGIIDEMRTSNIVRSTDWIETEYNNQNSPATFLSPQAEEVGPGPVGYWSFDEGYGATAHDETANKNNGTITGATWQDESMCVSGKCLYFDGTDETRVDADCPDNMGVFTVCTWVKANSLTNGDSDTTIHLVSKSWDLWFTDSGEVKFWIPTSGVYPEVRSTENISVNQWYYICAISNGIGSYPDLYIDGVNKGSGNATGDGNQDNDSSYSLRVGANWSNEYQGNLNGSIDEVKVYPYARTVDEIRQDYAAGLAGVKSSHGVAASFGSKSDSWMTDGLIAYWQLGESATTSGSVDSSGNGNDIIYFGNASSTAGKFGNGVAFDGNGDYVEIADSNSLNFSDGSISGWFKLNDNFDGSSPTSQIIMERYEGDSYHFIVVLAGTDYDPSNDYSISDGSLVFKVEKAPYATYGYRYIWTNQASWTAGVWYHFLVTNENGDGENNKIYINGVDDTLTNTGTMGPPIDFNATIRIGGSRADGSQLSGERFFNGVIDEIRMYNRVLGADEVEKLYEWTPGPVAYWKFDEMKGNTAYDSVASSSFAGGNDGTLGDDGIGTDLPTWGIGKYGSALNFDGSDDNLKINTNVNSYLDMSHGTISMWFKNNNTADNSRLFYFGNNGDDITARFINSTLLRLIYRYDLSTLYYLDVTVPDTTTDMDWHHYVFEWDVNGINSSANTMSATIDGVNNFTDTDAIKTPQAYSGYLYFGSNYDGVGSHVKGKMDDVRIYNYARTQKQILEDMSPFGGSPAGGNNALKHPILHLSFDEGYGAAAHDSSGYGNDGTLQPGTGGTNTASSAMWSLDGKFGKAMEFDGVDDYVEISGPTLSNSYSISMWFNPASDQSERWGLLIAEDFNDGIWYDRQDNKLDIYYSGTNRYSDMTITEDTWNHFVGINNNGTFVFYINGVSDTAVYTGAPGWTVQLIGNDPESETYNGLIDEVKIYNYALSEDEIKILYNQGQAAVMGAVGTATTTSATGGTVHVPTNAASAIYCVPGSSDYCTPPVGEWDFDEKAGTTTYDKSGHGNDGVFVNSASSPQWRDVGKIGSALKFDGDSDYVNIGSSADMQYTGAMTTCAWIKADTIDTVNEDYIIARCTAGIVSPYALYINDPGGGGRVDFGWTNDAGSSEVYATSPGTISTGKWYHLCAARNNTLDDVDIYINGVNTAVTSSGDVAVTTTVSNTTIGRLGDYTSANLYFDGIIDDVSIYDYARTPAQIAWDFNRGKPIAEWEFDECTGGVIHDSAKSWNGGTANNGVLHLGTTGTTATGTCASSSDSFWYNGRSGHKNSAGSFDGSDDGIRVDYDSLLQPTNSVAVGAWVYMSNWSDLTSGGFNPIALNTESGGYGLLADDPSTVGNGYVGFVVRRGGNYGSVMVDVDTLSSGWHYMLGVYDGRYAKLYIDGELMDTNDSGGNNSISYSQSNPFCIGFDSTAASCSSSYSFTGKIDEVRIYNYPLTPEQVKTEYNGGAVKFGN